MAIQINAGTPNRLEMATAPVTAPPLSMACRFKCADITGVNRLMCLKDKDAAAGTQQWRLVARGDLSGDPISFDRYQTSASSAGECNSTSGYSANNWHHACGVAASSSSGVVYLDGANSNTNTANLSPTGVDWLGLQVQLSSTSTYVASAGNITFAEVAIWNVALTAEQVLAMALGLPATEVQPWGLVCYWRARTVSDLFSPLGGLTLSGSGTLATVEHPPLMFRRRLWVPRFAAPRVFSRSIHLNQAVQVASNW